MARTRDSRKNPTAIVVGAGTGGIASAARLAKAGFCVTVVEKNAFTGGRCSLIHHDGYRFDQGPSLLLLPEMFHEAFSDLGTSMSAEGVELLKCEPNYRLWFGDGQGMELSTDMALMKREIEKWEGKDGFERYLSFLQEAHRHYELSVTHVLRKSFNSYASVLRPAFLRHLFSLHPFESIYSRAARYFRTDRLRRAFTFGSMYMGMSPFDAPGTYSLLQYTELAEGIWYPRGGFHAVLEALVKVAKRLGVDFRMEASVDHVEIDAETKRATGVKLSSGEILEADIVLINADLVYAYNNLFKDPQNPSHRVPAHGYAQSLANRATSCSSISFYWSLDRQLPQLGAHNIFLADEYQESFDSIFKDHVLPTEPSFYVNVPSRIDPSAAPVGKDALVVLVPCGHIVADDAKVGSGLANKSPTSSQAAIPSTKQDYPLLIEKARSRIISILNKRLAATSPLSCPASMRTTTYTVASSLAKDFDLAEHIIHEDVNHPLTWRDKFNLDRGAILGLAHDFFNVLCFRPRMRHEAVAGCYFVGASTQPGTGVPIVLAGSRVVVGEICKDMDVAASWLGNGKSANSQGRGPQRHELDVAKWLSYEFLSWAMVVVMSCLFLVIGADYLTALQALPTL